MEAEGNHVWKFGSVHFNWKNTQICLVEDDKLKSAVTSVL